MPTAQTPLKSSLGRQDHQAEPVMGGLWKWIVVGSSVLGLSVHAGERFNTGGNVVEVLLPGSYHADEVTAVAQPGWFALLVGPSSELMPGKLEIAIEYDPVLDPKEGPFSGKHVSFDPDSEAVVLLKGAMFVAGPLSAATVAGEYSGLSRKTIMFNNQQYLLQMDENCQEGSFQCEWIFSDGNTRQTIGRLGGSLQSAGFATEASNTGLLWAGDLDRDGQLDLIIDVSDHYNAVAQVRVLLSSAATGGELLGEVASFSAVGC